MLTTLLGTVAALGLMVVVSTSPSHAQAAPPLGTDLPTFAVLGGASVTNTGSTTLSGTAALLGNLGVYPGSSATGTGTCPAANCVTFSTGGAVHLTDATAEQAEAELFTAYTNLVSRPTSVNLTGQNLGGLTLVPGVYNFSSSAQLTGTLTLNGLGNPNSVFIINIGSTLTTASASSVTLINGAQGGNVFWRVGSSATLGTTTSFAGDILALSSITLDTGATITLRRRLGGKRFGDVGYQHDLIVQSHSRRGRRACHSGLPGSRSSHLCCHPRPRPMISRSQPGSITRSPAASRCRWRS